MSFTHTQMMNFFTLGIVYSIITLVIKKLLNKNKSLMHTINSFTYCIGGIVVAVFPIVGLRLLPEYIEQIERVNFVHGIGLYMFLIVPFTCFVNLLDYIWGLGIFDNVSTKESKEYHRNGVYRRTNLNYTLIYGLATSILSVELIKNIVIFTKDVSNTSTLIKIVIFGILAIISLGLLIKELITREINKEKYGTLLILLLTMTGIFFGVLGIKNYLDKDSYIKTTAVYVEYQKETSVQQTKSTQNTQTQQPELITLYCYQYTIDGSNYKIEDSVSREKKHNLGSTKEIYYHKEDESLNKIRKPISKEYLIISGISLSLVAILIFVNNIYNKNKNINNLDNNVIGGL